MLGASCESVAKLDALHDNAESMGVYLGMTMFYLGK
jgi:hypothetical protein